MEKMKLTIIDTNSGWIGIVGSSHGLREIILPQESEEAVLSRIKRHEYSFEICDSSLFRDLPHRLRRYFEGQIVHFPDKLDFARASRFQQGVWRITRSIPYGKTKSYAWIAGQMGLSKAARAVGQALGRNPLPIVIPCHRVIKSNGSLGGFSAGLEMKRYLLGIEEAGIR